MLGFLHQGHAPVAADIVKNSELSQPIAQKDQRNSEQGDRRDIARRRHVMAEADAGPGPGEEVIPLELKAGRIGVEPIG